MEPRQQPLCGGDDVFGAVHTQIVHEGPESRCSVHLVVTWTDYCITVVSELPRSYRVLYIQHWIHPERPDLILPQYY